MPSEVLARIRSVSLDWRDSARPAAFSGLTIEQVSHEAVGQDGFRLSASITGSRFFGAVATGTVVETDGRTIVRYTTALDPSFARAALLAFAVLFGFSVLLAALGGSWGNLFVIPIAGTLLGVVPSFAVANEALDGHSRALRSLVLKAAKLPRDTP